MQFALQNLAVMNSLQANIDRMNEIRVARVEEDSADFDPDGYTIRFQNVGFGYDDGESVLKDVSFTARQGQAGALVGPSVVESPRRPDGGVLLGHGRWQCARWRRGCIRSGPGAAA